MERPNATTEPGCGLSGPLWGWGYGRDCEANRFGVSVRVAAIQATSVWMDRAASVAKAVALIESAAAGGAEVVGLPESFVPGYPWWLELDGVGAASRWVRDRQSWYLHQGVVIDRGDLDPVVDAAKRAGCFVVVGVAERSRSRGSLYCSLVSISPTDGVVGVHRKLRPTTVERLCWADGDGHGLVVHDHRGVGVASLCCFEHWMPLARFALYAAGEQIHVGAWPGGIRLTRDVSTYIAREGRLWVVASGGVFDPDMIPAQFPGRQQLVDVAAAGTVEFGDGGSLIADPTGTIVAAADTGTEEIIYADIEAADLGRARYAFDPAGHYHRPDIFNLNINRARPDIITDS